MSKFLKSAAVFAAVSMISGPAMAEKMGLGRTALPAEIAAWDGDIQPNGIGLPVGSGDAPVDRTVIPTTPPSHLFSW